MNDELIEKVKFICEYFKEYQSFIVPYSGQPNRCTIFFHDINAVDYNKIQYEIDELIDELCKTTSFQVYAMVFTKFEDDNILEFISEAMKNKIELAYGQN